MALVDPQGKAMEAEVQELTDLLESATRDGRLEEETGRELLAAFGRTLSRVLGFWGRANAAAQQAQVQADLALAAVGKAGELALLLDNAVQTHQTHVSPQAAVLALERCN